MTDLKTVYLGGVKNGLEIVAFIVAIFSFFAVVAGTMVFPLVASLYVSTYQAVEPDWVWFVATLGAQAAWFVFVWIPTATTLHEYGYMDRVNSLMTEVNDQ